MGPTVLNVEPVPDEKSSVRVYAHCAAQRVQARAGAVVLLVINLGDVQTRVQVPSKWGAISQQLVLSPSFNPADSLIENTGLQGTGILLNGELLHLATDGSVPQLQGSHVGAPEARVPATSIAFFI